MFVARFVTDGKSVNYTPVGAVDAGAIVVLGKICGVATEAIPAGALGALAMRGVFECAKEASLVVTTGDALYYDESEECLTKTAAENIYFGPAVADSAAEDETVYALLRSIQDVVAEQFGLTDLSDCEVTAPAVGELLNYDGSQFINGKLTHLMVKPTALAGALTPLLVKSAVCTATGSGDQTVIADFGVKVQIIDAWVFARDTQAANVKLHQGTAGADDITDAVAKGTVDDVKVPFTKIIEEKKYVASGTAVKCNFSAAGVVEVVILARPST